MAGSNGFSRARSHIIFVLGLLAAVGIIMSIEARLADTRNARAAREAVESAWRQVEASDLAVQQPLLYRRAVVAAERLGIITTGARFQQLERVKTLSPTAETSAPESGGVASAAEAAEALSTLARMARD